MYYIEKMLQNYFKSSGRQENSGTFLFCNINSLMWDYLKLWKIVRNYFHLKEEWSISNPSCYLHFLPYLWKRFPEIWKLDRYSLNTSISFSRARFLNSIKSQRMLKRKTQNSRWSPDGTQGSPSVLVISTIQVGYKSMHIHPSYNIENTANLRTCDLRSKWPVVFERRRYAWTLRKMPRNSRPKDSMSRTDLDTHSSVSLHSAPNSSWKWFIQR